MTAVRLRPGAMVGPYRIEALAGEGAMGRVYRATDVRLDRAVALKVLPEELVEDPAHLSRFEHEAKAASALNHPNIVTVYEVGEQVVSTPGSGSSREMRVPFIAMEYVDGKSLRDILSTGPLSIKKTLEIAVQAAEALMRAHEAGIVHRDLKPDNLMVRPDGYVKVLDFGLARVTHPGKSSMARTLDGEYFVVGTASYMSPEQARGKNVDGRSDIFSFGVVLYEALAGRPPFSGDSAVDVLSSMLHDDPAPLSDTAPHVPRDLARTIERCLAKDPEERFQSMRDLSLELKAIRRDFDSGLISSSARRSLLPAPRRAFRRASVAAGIGSAILLGIGVAVVRRALSPPSVRVERLTASGTASAAAISPDGARVAYVENGSPRRLMMRDRRGTSALAIDTGGIAPFTPSFSADGLSLYFSGADAAGERSIFRVDVLGGSPRKLLAGYRPSPSPDGRFLAYLLDRGGNHPSYDLCVAGPNGDLARCTAIAPAPDALFSFAWSRDGRRIHVALGSGQSARTRLGILDPRTGRVAYAADPGESLPMMLNGFAADPASDDLLFTGSPIYGRGGELSRRHGAAFSAVTSGVSDYRGLSVDAAGIAAVTANYRENSNIEQVTVSAHPRADSEGARVLTEDNEGDYRPIWSPDGSKIAFTSTRTGSRSIWIMNADGGAPRELTPEKSDYGWPAWSPDGKSVSYSCNRTGNHEVYLQALEGGPPRRITTSAVFNGQASFSPDGRTIFFESADRAGNPILKRTDLSSGKTEIFANEDDEFPVVSPDGRFVAVTSEPELDQEIPVYVLRIADRRRVFQTRVSSTGHLITWMPDSSSIVAILKEKSPPRQNAFRVPLDGGPPERLTDFPEGWRLHGCAIDPSGRRLLIVRVKDNSDIVAIAPLRGPTFREWLTGTGRR
jgi:serine/threonine protein kinase/Tol biopolymer transport system component